MRPKPTTRHNDWIQIGIGAGALLLPPLALGAALYSMLAPPAEDFTRPTVAQAAVPPLATAVSPAGKSTSEMTRPLGHAPVQGASASAAPVQVAVTTAAGVNPSGEADGTAVALPPAAENPPASPKRTVHRHARPQQDTFPLKNWLQQIGILPRNTSKDGRG
jgi:hypothetical protein